MNVAVQLMKLFSTESATVKKGTSETFHLREDVAHQMRNIPMKNVNVRMDL